MRRMFVVVMLLQPIGASAGGFSTVLPLTISPSVTTPGYGAGRYIDAPVPMTVSRSMAASVPKRNLAGETIDLLKHFFDGGGPVTYDPTTGTPIGQFGEAYTYASPVGRGLASREQTVGPQ